MEGYSHYVSFKTGTTIDKKLIVSFLDECEMLLSKENLPENIRFFGYKQTNQPAIDRRGLYLGIGVPPRYKHRGDDAEIIVSIDFDNKKPDRYPIYAITTHREEYDFVIGAIVLSLAHWLKDHVYATTDGDQSDENWKQAISYYKYITERDDVNVFFAKRR